MAYRGEPLRVGEVDGIDTIRARQGVGCLSGKGHRVDRRGRPEEACRPRAGGIGDVDPVEPCLRPQVGVGRRHGDGIPPTGNPAVADQGRLARVAQVEDRQPGVGGGVREIARRDEILEVQVMAPLLLAPLHQRVSAYEARHGRVADVEDEQPRSHFLTRPRLAMIATHPHRRDA